MKLGINIVRLSRLFTGVGRYLECLLNEWTQMELPFDEVILYTPSQIKQEHVIFPLDRFKIEIIGPHLPDPLWEWISLSPKAREIDLLFCPSYTIPIGYSGKCSVTYLGPSENTPLTFQWWRSRVYEYLYNYSAHKADHVFTVSDSVKRYLVEKHKVESRKVTVTLLGASVLFRPIDDELLLRETRKKFLGKDTPYILFVGKLAKRHYIPNLLQAFAEIYKAGECPYKLLLAGPDYLNLDIPKLSGELGIQSEVIHIPYIHHHDLPAVYSAAEMFIFPASEAEGFGIPVIEAMACGTPVITVNQGSLSEFAQGASCLVKNSSVEELKSGLERLIKKPDLRADLSKKGIQRAKTMSWKATAKKTMDILWQVANG